MSSLWKQFQQAWRRSRKGILIGGCARSGTTLMLSILSSHPLIAAVPMETQALCPTAYDPHFNPAAPFDLQRIDQEIDAVWVSGQSRRWCEKTPKNVWFFHRHLDTWGSQIKIIQIVRDGRDVIVSRHPSDPSRHWVTADRWIHDVGVGLDLRYHPQVLTIRYEDIVLQFEETIQSVLEFLRLPVCQEVLTFPSSAKVRSSRAWSGDIQPIHSDSIGRWKREHHAERIQAFMKTPRAVKLLREYNYIS